MKVFLVDHNIGSLSFTERANSNVQTSTMVKSLEWKDGGGNIIKAVSTDDPNKSLNCLQLQSSSFLSRYILLPVVGQFQEWSNDLFHPNQSRSFTVLPITLVQRFSSYYWMSSKTIFRCFLLSFNKMLYYKIA